MKIEFMWKQLKSSFPFLLLMWLALTIIAYKPDKNVGLGESVLISLAGSILITCTYAFAIHKFPKEVEKIFARKSYQTLINNGFIRSDNSLVGQIKNFTTILNIKWDLKTRPSIEVTILFDPESYGHYFSKKEFDAIVERNNGSNLNSAQKNKWTINSITGNVLFGLFHEPNYHKIINKINDLVAILMNEKLKPISQDQLQMKISSIENHYANNTE